MPATGQLLLGRRPYRARPAAAQSKLAKARFWIYVPARFIQTLALFLFFRGHTAIEPLLAGAAIVVGVAILCFAGVVLQHTGTAA